ASYRFDEFVRAASWDPNALAPSWSGADAEGTLADIVQRMLGDGYFNYDFVTYTVAPRFYTMQDTAPQSPFYPSCVGCSFVGVQVIIAEPLFGCDAFFAPCVGVRRFAHRDRFTDSGIRSVDLPMNVIALALGPARTAAVMTPSGVPVRMAAPFGVQPLARSSVVGGAGATAQLPAAQLPATQLPATQLPPAQLHGMALPGATWRAVGSRGAVVRAT